VVIESSKMCIWTFFIFGVVYYMRGYFYF
jgi:hypothetical protein